MPLSRWHQGLDRWELGSLTAHTGLGWRWDELGTGMGPFPSCGPPSPSCACTPASGCYVTSALGTAAQQGASSHGGSTLPRWGDREGG